MTLLGFVNRVVFQWFFIRLARQLDKNDKQIGWTWLTGVVPMTGWNTDYRYIKQGDNL